MGVAKLVLTAMCAALIVGAVTVFPQKPCFEGGKNYTFYCGTSSKDCKVVTAENDASLLKLCLKNVCGESVEYENGDLDEILEKTGGKVVFTEEFSDSVNYYCTADLPYSVDLHGTRINLHVCVREDCIKVASPIIFGGY